MNGAWNVELPRELHGGRYLLGEPLGEGGTATVVRARDTALQVDRAIKLIAHVGREQAQLRRRLSAEARAMASLRHPHVLAVHDVGTEGDFDYIVMDLAPGGSLVEIGEGGPLPPRLAVRYALEVLSALGAAHDAGIVHRDVKPHNVLLDGRGRAVLADFGIAMLSAAEDRRTRTGVAMGSVAYMPPEQRLDAAKVTPSADIYAMGATLYGLLTGENPVDLFLADPDSPRWHKVPETLRPVLIRAAKPHPADRYPSATAFAQAILEASEAFGGPETPVLLPLEPAPRAPMDRAQTTLPTFAEPSPPTRTEPTGRRARLALLIGAILTALLWGVVPWAPPPPTRVTVADATPPVTAIGADPDPRVAPRAERAARPERSAEMGPTRASSPVAGSWTGSLGGVELKLQLGGPPEALSGAARSSFGPNVREVPVQGRLDPTTRRLTLREPEGPDPARWELDLSGDGTAMDGKVTTSSGRVRTLVLRRSAP